MKIKFIEAPKGRDHKVGDVAEFSGPIPEGYARKYIARGWAVEVTDEKPVKNPEAPKVESAKAPSATTPVQRPHGVASRIT